MCTVSMVAQDWSDRWRDRLPNQFPFGQPNQFGYVPQISRAEFDALRAELESVKKLLRAAKQYDAETGQPDCEDADKIALFRGLAKMLDVDLGDVFPANKA